jgi:hypothetical protein
VDGGVRRGSEEVRQWELASDEIDDIDEVLVRALAAGKGLGRLKQTADGLQHPHC